MEKKNLTEIEKITGVVLTEEVKQRILNDWRNPIKDWGLLNSDNPLKLLYFTRVLMSLVLEKSEDPIAVALAKLFNALDSSTNLMHAWETTHANEKNGKDTRATSLQIKQITIGTPNQTTLTIASTERKV